MLLIILKNIRCSKESLFDSHKLDLVSIIYLYVIYKEHLKINLHYNVLL
jgi:hypothetical protein